LHSQDCYYFQHRERKLSEVKHIATASKADRTLGHRLLMSANRKCHPGRGNCWRRDGSGETQEKAENNVLVREFCVTDVSLLSGE
jgi:hypothetical protein